MISVSKFTPGVVVFEGTISKITRAAVYLPISQFSKKNSLKYVKLFMGPTNLFVFKISQCQVDQKYVKLRGLF